MNTLDRLSRLIAFDITGPNCNPAHPEAHGARTRMEWNRERTLDQLARCDRFIADMTAEWAASRGR